MIFIGKTKDSENQAINIRSIQANSLYQVNNGQRSWLDMSDAVISDSLFIRYMSKHGVTARGHRKQSRDFIILKFDYGAKLKSGEEETDRQYEKTAKQLREYYYKYGADVTWETRSKEKALVQEETIHYKMLMRSPGKAKNGDCIFIRDNLHKVAMDYITMGLYDRMPDENADIVGMSAYSTLVTATALDYIDIPMDNILIVRDEKVSTLANAVAVRSKTIDGEDECYVDRSLEKREVSNILWDGMGLIDESIFPEESGMDGFIYCRNHFFKSCLFRGDIQAYFKDHYRESYDTAVVTDMFGNNFKVSDVKVIVTDKSIKWMKFINLMGGTEKAAYKYYRKHMRKHGRQFAIVKTAHKSKWGALQRTSYQINNSLPCTDQAILERIADTSIDYVNSLKTDHCAFIKHLSMDAARRYSINNVLVALDEWNDNFKYTQYFKDKRTKIISKFKNERLKLGKLLQYGDNLTICGNPIALLMKVTGQDFRDEPCFRKIDEGIECYTTRFADGEGIAGFRSPHNSPNNIVHLVNTYSESLQKYFSKLGENVIVINGIGTDVQSRLNGQDLDSDCIFATNQLDMVQLAAAAYKKYPTIVNDIGETGKCKYRKDMESYAEMDHKISAAQMDIGNASNKAQLALSYYYDGGGVSQELEDVFIICSVLAQLSIDSAKKEFDIKSAPEITRLSKLPCMEQEEGKKYPIFYADVQRIQKSYIVNPEQVREFQCPMEILSKIIDDNVIDMRRQKELNTRTCNFSMVFTYEASKRCDGHQYKKMIELVTEYDKSLKAMDKYDADYSDRVISEFETCMSKINRLTIKQETMSSLIAYAFTSNGDVRDRLLVALFERDSELFLNCFKKDRKIHIDM